MDVFAGRTLWYSPNFLPNFVNFKIESIKAYKNYYDNLPLGHTHQWLHNQTGYSIFKDKQNNLNN